MAFSENVSGMIILAAKKLCILVCEVIENQKKMGRNGAKCIVGIHIVGANQLRMEGQMLLLQYMLHNLTEHVI